MRLRPSWMIVYRKKNEDDLLDVQSRKDIDPEMYREQLRSNIIIYVYDEMVNLRQPQQEAFLFSFSSPSLSVSPESPSAARSTSHLPLLHPKEAKDSQSDGSTEIALPPGLREKLDAENKKKHKYHNFADPFKLLKRAIKNQTLRKHRILS